MDVSVDPKIQIFQRGMKLLNGTLSNNVQIERKGKWELDNVFSSQRSDHVRTVYIQRKKNKNKLQWREVRPL